MMHFYRRCLAVWALGLLAAAPVACGSETDVLPGPETFNVHTTGDSLTIAGGLITVVVPAGAISADGNITATELPSGSFPASPLLAGSHAYELSFSPATVQVLQPITIELNYSSLGLPTGVRSPEVRLASVVGGVWRPIPGGTNNSVTRRCRVHTRTPGDIAVLGLPVDTVLVAPTSMTVAAGATRTITTTPMDSLGDSLSARRVTYASSDVTKARVSSGGTVSGVAVGTATITVMSETKSADVPVTITQGAVSTSLSAVSVSAATVVSGGTVTATLQAKDVSGTNLAAGGLAVVFTRSGGTSTGTFGTTADHANGTYTAVFTAATAGTATTVHATIGGTAVTSTMPTITVTSGSGSGASTSLSTVSVSAATVVSGSTVTATLQAKDGSGTNLTTGGLTVVFTRSGGTSSGTFASTTDHANGTYTAVFTGTTAGTATTVHATIGGTAVTSTLPTVSVTPGAVSMSKSTVTASTGTVAPGGTATLTLQTKDANSNNLTTGGLTVAFTVGGGTSTGTIGATTDHANGSYTAIFTAGVAGTAMTVQATIGGAAVTSTPPTITVASGGSLWPNEPSGFTKFTERAFNTEPPNGAAEDGWTTDYSSYSGVTIVQDATAPKSPQNVGQALYPRGFASGSGPVDAERLLTGTSNTQLYLSFWMKLSSNWYNNDGAGITKIIFVWVHGKPVVFLGSGGGNGNEPMYPRIYTQNSPDGGADHYDNHGTGIQVVRGQWQRWEVLLVCNTAGNADGTLKWWIDGTLVGSYTNVSYSASSEGHTWENVAWNPTYGGLGGPVPADQQMWIDHIYVSMKP